MIKRILCLAVLIVVASCSSNKYAVVSNTFGNPSNIIINPWDPINPPGPTDPPVPDGSSSFNDAVVVEIGDEAVDDFQTQNDVDYFSFLAERTNYIYFNIEYGIGTASWFEATIDVYKEINDTPVFQETYNNHISMYCFDLSDLPAIYVEPGEKYYFKVYKTDSGSTSALRSDDPNVIGRRYFAHLFYANCTDVSNRSLYESNGYLLNYELGYLSDNIIKVFFDERAYNYQNVSEQRTYRDIALEAMSIWNAVGTIQFVETFDETEQEIYFYTLMDGPEGYNILGQTDFSYGGIEPYSRALVWVNNDHFYNVNYKYCLKTSVHELGHSLGINDLDYTGCNDIMQQGYRQYNKLGKGDIDLYRYMYGD